jgi:hypothetical protein
MFGKVSLALFLIFLLGNLDWTVQISSWWSGSPSPTAEKPYDPTDPKQNPLNPKGLKPCALPFLIASLYSHLSYQVLRMPTNQVSPR